MLGYKYVLIVSAFAVVSFAQTGADQINTKRDEAGAVSRRVKAKLNDILSLKDFIPPTVAPTADMTTYFSNALHAIGRPSGSEAAGTMFIPPGSYGTATGFTYFIDYPTFSLSNIQIYGGGKYSTQLYQICGSNLNGPLFGGTNDSGTFPTAAMTRRNFWGLTFNGNQSCNSGTSDGFLLGPSQDDISVHHDNVYRDNTGSGIATPYSINGTTSLDLHFHDNIIGGNLMHGLDVRNHWNEWAIENNLINDNNNGCGMYLNGAGVVLPNIFFSKRNHIERNVQGICDVNIPGLMSVADRIFAVSSFVGEKAINSSVYGHNSPLPFYMAAPYSLYTDPKPEPNMFYTRCVGCNANRAKFPYPEQYLDLDQNPIPDADMGDISDATYYPTDPNQSGTVASISKAPYRSDSIGKYYLRIKCSVAPCGAVNTFSVKDGSDWWYRVIYNGTNDTISQDTPPPSVRIEIRDAVTHDVLVASPDLTPNVTFATRMDDSWQTNLTVRGITQIEIALICLVDGARGCLFTDQIMVPDYVRNGGFENDLTDWTIAGTGCEVVTDVHMTGAKSLHAPAGTGCKASEFVGTHYSGFPPMKVGEYYWVRAWVHRTVDGNSGYLFGVGLNPGTGTVVDYGFRTGATAYDGIYFKGNDRNTGEPAWELKEFIIQYESLSLFDVMFSGIQPIVAEDGYIDNVSVLHLNQNPQHKQSSFVSTKFTRNPEMPGIYDQNVTADYTADANYRYHLVTLKANINFAISNPPDDADVSGDANNGSGPTKEVTITFCQDAPGSRTVTPNANIHGFTTIDSVGLHCTVESFYWNQRVTGGNWVAASEAKKYAF